MSAGHARAAITRMLRFRRDPATDPPWFRVLAMIVPLGPAGWLLRRVGRLWVWTVLSAVFGLGLGLVPLFGVLGLELAVAAALFAAVMGIDLGYAVARELQTMPTPGISRSLWPGRTLARSTAAGAGLAVAVITIPALIGALRGIWVPTCDWTFGIVAYLALPVATAALAGAFGHALGVVLGPQRYGRPLLAQLPLLLIAGGALWRFYAEPPVFSYNAILGYFPGNLYDERIQLGAALAWSRLEQLLWLIAIVALVGSRLDVPTFRIRLRAPRPAGRRLGALAIAAGCAAAAVAVRWHGGALGYAVDAEDIEDALGGRLETAHFIIHFATTPEIEGDLQLIAADHELRYAQVTSQIAIEPAGKIRSFYFADRDQKSRLMGARDVEMAKPWRREIYLDHRAFPHGSLRHEIAHAVASEFGDPVLGLAARRVLGLPLLISPGLVEGFAVALDWPAGYDRPNPHESVRAMQAMGGQPPIDQLLGLQFFSVSSARSYTTAGSFLRFLLDRHGPERLRALYRTGGEFDEAYGQTRGQLEAEWRAMVSAIDVPPAAVESQKERFRATSVFARPCPHAIAARRERALEAVAQGDRPGAVALMRRVCSDAPDEPRHQIELGDLLVSGDQPAERAEAEQLWSRIASDDQTMTSSLRALAYERLARVAGGRGDLATATALVAQAVQLPIDPTERRTLDAMAFALAHRGPAGDALRSYFFAPTPGMTPLAAAVAATLAEPRLGLARYLLGLQRAAHGDWAASAAELERALGDELPGLPFVKNAARRLAVAAYRVGDRSRLGVAITVLSSSRMSSGDHWLAMDWLERATLDATGKLR